MKVLNIENLTKTYGKSRGVKDINLNIESGTVYGFIGPNGAGKSTTIKCIMNMINKNKGNIYVNDILVSNKNFDIKEQIGYLPSEIHLYDDLTVKKMLDYSASFYKKDCKKKQKSLVKRLEIDTTKKINELSLGNLKKVGIVLALMHNPKFIIMDEATSGLDPLMQEVFYEIIEEEKDGKTIFFSSHILNEVKRICDKVAIIKDGEIIKNINIDELIDSNYLKITLEAKDITKILKELNIKQTITKTKEKVEFLYQENINNLLKTLKNYNIKKLLIKEVDIEDIFIDYYK